MVDLSVLYYLIPKDMFINGLIRGLLGFIIAVCVHYIIKMNKEMNSNSFLVKKYTTDKKIDRDWL